MLLCVTQAQQTENQQPQQQQQVPLVTHSTLLGHLQKHSSPQKQRAPPAAYATTHQPQTNVVNTAQSSPYGPPYPSTDQAGAKVYRMGSSVTQVYSKNYPTRYGSATVESATGNNSRSVMDS